MRVWRYQGVHRLTWVLLVLLVLALAVFGMAAGFGRLRSRAIPEPAGSGTQGRVAPAALATASGWLGGLEAAQASPDSTKPHASASFVSLAARSAWA
jgi:hypothetical protein